jgi:hypothetical protein
MGGIWAAFQKVGFPVTNKRQQEEAKKVLAEVQYELDTQPLTAAQREELELHAARLAGAILSPWLPVSWGRRLIMLGIVLLGIQQAWWAGNYQPFLWWLLLPFFSPRIVATCAFYLGRVARYFR